MSEPLTLALYSGTAAAKAELTNNVLATAHIDYDKTANFNKLQSGDGV